MDFLNYWGLQKKPFENIGDPGFFYYSPCHKEAMVRLIYVIQQNKAGALLAGDYGTGKTTIAQEILAEIQENAEYKSVYISNPLLSSKELLEEVAFQLGVNADTGSRVVCRRRIDEKLKQTASEGYRTVIIVDEAHIITRKDVLEELRLMMNMQMVDKFLVTLILMGQLELKDTINAMPQFKQRFAMCYLLRHLNKDETLGYISHRLKIAGVERNIFNTDARNLIYASSSGRPRQINNICDMALLIGYMNKVECVDTDVIHEVIGDIGKEGTL